MKCRPATLDPRIGILGNGAFYAFAHGYDKPETRGTLAQVMQALGSEASPVPGAFRTTTRPRLREYLVTVTPRIKTYAGTFTFDEYSTAVMAVNSKDAISKARLERKEQDGRYAVPAAYRARLLNCSLPD